MWLSLVGQQKLPTRKKWGHMVSGIWLRMKNIAPFSWVMRRSKPITGGSYERLFMHERWSQQASSCK